VVEERGLSLRFPRFLRKRGDKGVEEASTGGFLAGLYRKQEGRVRAPVAGEKRERDGGREVEEDGEVEVEEEDGGKSDG
jgi:DNA ligase-1